MPENIPIPVPEPTPEPDARSIPDLGPGPGINIGEEFGTAKRNFPPAKIVAIVLGIAAVILGIFAFVTRAKPQGDGSLDNIAVVEIPDQHAVMVARLRYGRRSRHQLVRARHSLGAFQGHAPPRRKGRQALSGMEPHGDGHALSRWRHGRALPADPLDAGLRCSQATAGSQGVRLPFHRRETAARPRAQPRRCAHSRAALRPLTATPRSTGCSSWTSISPWRPTG